MPKVEESIELEVPVRMIRVSGTCSVTSASRVVDLPHLLDVFHEARKLLELRPLVVRRLSSTRR